MVRILKLANSLSVNLNLQFSILRISIFAFYNKPGIELTNDQPKT